jgi:hypothetical protein
MMEALVIAVSLSLVVAMTIAWLIQRRTSNAGWVDVVWSFALGAAGVIYALYPLHTGMPSARQFLIAALAAFWSLRLGLHIAARTVHGSEDSRYAQFRRDWGGTFQRRMFWFLQIQAAAAALLALSMLLAARNPRPLSLPTPPPARCCWCLSSARPSRTSNYGDFVPPPPTTAGSARSGCGGGRAIRITSSNFSAGLPTRCSRSIYRAAIHGAAIRGVGWRYRHRRSCIGCWCTFPAYRRWNSKCCARAVTHSETIRRASAPSFRFPQ